MLHNIVSTTRLLPAPTPVSSHRSRPRRNTPSRNTLRNCPPPKDSNSMQNPREIRKFCLRVTQGVVRRLTTSPTCRPCSTRDPHCPKKLETGYWRSSTADKDPTNQVPCWAGRGPFGLLHSNCLPVSILPQTRVNATTPGQSSDGAVDTNLPWVAFSRSDFFA